MNAQKYTQNSLAAIEAAKSLTLEHQNQTMEPCHILYALLAQEKGLIPQLIEDGYELVTVSELLNMEPLQTSEEKYVFPYR